MMSSPIYRVSINIKEKDDAGNYIVAIFDINNDLNGENAHRCTTIHGRDSIPILFEKLSDSAVIYTKNSSEKTMTGEGILKSPKLLSSSETVMKILAQSRNTVKPNLSIRMCQVNIGK